MLAGELEVEFHILFLEYLEEGDIVIEHLIDASRISLGRRATRPFRWRE